MRALTRTRVRMVPTVVKTRFAGEASTAFLSRISILTSKSGTSAMDVRATVTAGLGKWDGGDL